MTHPRAETLRRYPALAFFGVAAMLAVTLPSALRVPNTGPPTLAEFAPVPGTGSGGGGDLGRLGAGTSGGLGAGSGSPTGRGAPDPGQPSASLKRCVGSPPRQTEDPLSPPCVAFFEGDNFGATMQGVSSDEIVVVVELGGSAGTYTLVDIDDPDQRFDHPVDDAFLAVLASYGRFFNQRYQTYGRRIHLYALRGGGSVEEVRAEMGRLRRELGPFALVSARITDSLLVAREGGDRREFRVRQPGQTPGPLLGDPH